MINVHLKPHRAQRKKKTTTKAALCDASIPLSFITLSSGSIKRLVKNIGIFNLEDLHRTEKQTIEEHIKNKDLRREIFALKFQVSRIIQSSKHRNILLFEEKIKGKNIKIKPSQRARLIGVALFSRLLKNPEEVLSYVLEIHDEGTPFREKALLLKIKDCSKQSLPLAV